MAHTSHECPSTDALLAAFEDPERMTESVRLHTRTCPTCRAALEDTPALLRTVRDDIARDTAAGASERRQRVHLALRSQAPQAAPGRRWRRRLPVAATIAAGAVLLIGGVATVQRLAYADAVSTRALERERAGTLARARTSIREEAAGRVHVRTRPLGAAETARCAPWEGIVEPQDPSKNLPPAVARLLRELAIVSDSQASTPGLRPVAAYLAWRDGELRSRWGATASEQADAITLRAERATGAVRSAELTVDRERYDVISLNIASDGCRVDVEPVTRSLGSR